MLRGPNLPINLVGHCMVKLQDRKIMILGGRRSKKVFIFHPDRKTFTNGPSLVNDFFYGGCVLISSPLHKNRHVVLAVGGTLWPYRTSNAQILDYTQPQASWEKSNYLCKYDYNLPNELTTI